MSQMETELLYVSAVSATKWKPTQVELQPPPPSSTATAIAAAPAAIAKQVMRLFGIQV